MQKIYLLEYFEQKLDGTTTMQWWWRHENFNSEILGVPKTGKEPLWNELDMCIGVGSKLIGGVN
jgi:hypothetical protein